jgi:hypothetical protein
MSEIQERIEKVLRAHRNAEHEQYDHFRQRNLLTCTVCGSFFRNAGEHATRIASAVLALFSEEWSDDVGGPDWARYCRWVSETEVHHGPKYLRGLGTGGTQ